MINVPIVAALLVLAPLVLPDGRPSSAARRFDLPGALLVTLGAMTIVDTLVQAPTVGWGSPRTLLEAAARLLLLGLFLTVERRAEFPLLPPRLLRTRTVRGRMTPATSFPTDDWRSHSPDFSGERFRRNLQVVERLKQFARERAITLPELAVAWTLAHPAVQVAIVGARQPAQLDGRHRRRPSPVRRRPSPDRGDRRRRRAGVGPPPRRHVTPQEHSAVIRTTVNDHAGSAI